MSAFAGLFLRSVAWGALCHFSKRITDAAICNASWRDIAEKTAGVMGMYPVVESAIVKAARLDGADEPTIMRLRVWTFFGYALGAVSVGTGVVFGRVIDERIGK